MNVQFKYHIHFAAIFALIFLVANCSDDSPTSVDPSEAPEVPDSSTPVEIDNSIFQNNEVTGEEYEAFNEAGTYVATANSQLQASSMSSDIYLSFTQNQEAEYNDGIWEWTYTYAEGNEEMSIQTTAEELDNGIEWNLYISGQFEDGSVSEFRYMSGFVSNDRTSGSWQFFSPEDPGQPILEYEWNAVSDDESAFSTTFTNPEDGTESRVDYNRNGNENLLEYTGFGTGSDLTIFWDGSTGSGYIDQEGEDRQCWDESYAEVACS